MCVCKRGRAECVECALVLCRSVSFELARRCRRRRRVTQCLFMHNKACVIDWLSAMENTLDYANDRFRARIKATTIEIAQRRANIVNV